MSLVLTHVKAFFRSCLSSRVIAQVMMVYKTGHVWANGTRIVERLQRVTFCVHVFLIISVVMDYWGASMCVHRQKHTLAELSVLSKPYYRCVSKCKCEPNRGWRTVWFNLLLRTVTPLEHVSRKYKSETHKQTKTIHKLVCVCAQSLDVFQLRR